MPDEPETMIVHGQKPTPGIGSGGTGGTVGKKPNQSKVAPENDLNYEDPGTPIDWDSILAAIEIFLGEVAGIVGALVQALIAPVAIAQDPQELIQHALDMRYKEELHSPDKKVRKKARDKVEKQKQKIWKAIEVSYNEAKAAKLASGGYGYMPGLNKGA